MGRVGVKWSMAVGRKKKGKKNEDESERKREREENKREKKEETKEEKRGEMWLRVGEVGGEKKKREGK